MKIGIFGGSFNPPHRMHKQIAEELLRGKNLDMIFVVPVGNGYDWSNKKLLPYKDRIELVTILFKDVPNVEISDIEKDGSIRTWDLMQEYHRRYPTDQLYYVCGADNFADLYRWYKYENLLKEFRFLIVGRNTDDYEEVLKRYKDYANHISLAKVDMDNVSSTEIRKLIEEGGFSSDVEKLIPKEVCEALKIMDYQKYWNIGG